MESTPTSTLLRFKQEDGSFTTVYPVTTLNNIIYESDSDIKLHERLNLIENMLADIMKDPIGLMYPVGSVYISVNDIDPAYVFNVGTWERINDVFLLAAGSTYPPNTTGGEATHTLTIEEMPTHNHTITHPQWYRNETGTATDTDGYGVSNKTLAAYIDDESIESAGGGLAHNNMPPYMTVYMWKRIA